MTSPVQFPGPEDAGGRDTVAGSVAGAVDAAVGRYVEHQSDTFSQGSTVGDLMTLPPVPEQDTSAVPPLYDQGDQPGA